MNGFHFAHIVGRLAPPRPRRVAISTGLVVLGLVVISPGLGTIGSARMVAAAPAGSPPPFRPRLPTRLRGIG